MSYSLRRCRTHWVIRVVALLSILWIAHPPANAAMGRYAVPLTAVQPVVGIAGWSGAVAYYNVRAYPQTAAAIVAHLTRGTTVQILQAVRGEAIAGVQLWYQVRLGTVTGYVLASGVASVQVAGVWTGEASDNGGVGVPNVTVYTAPRADASADAYFALGTLLTVLETVQGVALQPGNTVWYRVSTGSYRPVYLYSAYLTFVRRGPGPVPQPLLSAAAALVIDSTTQRVLYAANATVPRAPASLVKLMTAVVALDDLAPSTEITVPVGAPSVGAAINGAAMGLVPGETLTLTDLLYGMLLPSGNDAAYTIAAAVAGSQRAFAARMNARAATLGMVGTHFVQSYGFDAPGEYSTAQDLALLARYALQHDPLIARIVSTTTYTIPATASHPVFVLHNLNSLLGAGGYPGAYGVKTGTTPAAGENLIAAVSRDGYRVLAVVLGSSDRYADMTALLNYAIAERVRLG